MTLDLPFRIPQPPGEKDEPEWTSVGFRLGDRITRVLSFAPPQTDWSDDLALLHEEDAGATHFITAASRRHAIGQLAENLISERPTILEVGCSYGHLLRDMKVRFPYAVIIGADYARGPLESLALTLPSIPLFQFDLPSCPLPDQTFDAVVLLNVLEHIKNDRAALRQIWRLLKPGGVAIIEVPAGPGLYDFFDATFHHYRRYSMRELAGKLAEVGFRLRFRSHLGCLIYPAFWLRKKLNRVSPPTSDAQRTKRVKQMVSESHRQSRLLGQIVAVEDAVRDKAYLPFGIRCLVTAVR
jgi:SAM-dependent methyltransferase